MSDQHPPLPPEPPEEVKEAYLRDLGGFVHQFARVEKLLAGALWQYSGMTVVMGQAVLSGVRTKEACSLLNRVFEARHMQERPEAKDIAMIGAQIGHIADMRNAILHFGTNFIEGPIDISRSMSGHYECSPPRLRF